MKNLVRCPICQSAPTIERHSIMGPSVTLIFCEPRIENPGDHFLRVTASGKTHGVSDAKAARLWNKLGGAQG